MDQITSLHGTEVACATKHGLGISGSACTPTSVGTRNQAKTVKKFECYRSCYMWLQTMEMYSILKTK